MGRESNARVTNAVISLKLEHLIESHQILQQRIEAHSQRLEDHMKEEQGHQQKLTLILLGDPAEKDRIGLIGRLGTLEADMQKRQKHVWFLYTALVPIVLIKAWDWLKSFSIAVGGALPK